VAVESVEIAGYPVWRTGEGGLEVRFAGRGPAGEREAILAAIEGPLPVAWARQVHSATVLAAECGCGGEGDALVTDRRGLALAIGTADCVPVVVGAADALAVIHAGWRGIVAGVVPAAVARLARSPASLTAWIGPAIGPCCYEVDWDLAREVVAAGGAPAALDERGDTRRPHLDLAAAVAAQLAAAGVAVHEVIASCTRCSGDLWSFRRDGRGTGRNLAFAWLVR
jgi:hypothetical protein